MSRRGFGSEIIRAVLSRWTTAEKIYNVLPIKGAAVDGNGEQWLATVEDAESQLRYGIREKVLTLPSAYSAADAERWGKNQLLSMSKPALSAKVGEIQLPYPLAGRTV